MQELTFLEFFCGEGRVWKAVSASTKSSLGVDIRYWEPDHGHRNPYDILSEAGFGSGPKIDVHVSFVLNHAWLDLHTVVIQFDILKGTTHCM